MGGENSTDRERDLKRMGKSELIRMVFVLEAQVDTLTRKIESMEKEAREKEQDRMIELSEAGSIAEASIRITDVFEEAQRAADTYLFNIREMEEHYRLEADVKMRQAEKDADKVLEEAKKQADTIIDHAKSEGQRLRREAEFEAAKREREAEKYYENIKERTRSALMNLSRFNEDYERLKKIAEQQPDEAMLVVSNEDGNTKKNVAGVDGTIDPKKLYKSVDSLIEERKEAS
ncbi:MAG: hypothetical protein IJV04_00485 [Lachnospiraceae bacterium]|nr:hypothetical protein [Lachnospiraceae bacterium]